SRVRLPDCEALPARDCADESATRSTSRARGGRQVHLSTEKQTSAGELYHEAVHRLSRLESPPHHLSVLSGEDAIQLRDLQFVFSIDPFHLSLPTRQVIAPTATALEGSPELGGRS